MKARHVKLGPVDYTSKIRTDADGAVHHGIDWGKMGGDRTIITLTVTDGPKAAAKIADAIKWLQAEYPGCEIQVRGLDGRGWEKVT